MELFIHSWAVHKKYEWTMYSKLLMKFFVHVVLIVTTLQGFAFASFWSLPPRNHSSYPALIMHLCLFDFICCLTTCVHLLVSLTNHNLTQHLVHIWSFFYLGKLCNHGGQSVFPSRIAQINPVVSMHIEIAQIRPTTLLWKTAQSRPVALLPEIAKSRQPNLSLENCTYPPDRELRLKIVLTRQEASLALGNCAKLRDNMATRPRNNATIFPQLLFIACVDRLPGSLQNNTILPCMHGSFFSKWKKAKNHP